MAGDPNSPIRVLSFDNALSVSGITSWNLRAAIGFANAPELGVHWTAVEIADKAELDQILPNVPSHCRDRICFIEKDPSNSAWSLLPQILRQLPGLEDIDVVIPNGAVPGWELPQYIFRKTGRRPAVLGSVHNDKEVDYVMLGEGITGCDGIFAVSHHCQKELVRRYPQLPEPFFIPYGVPVADAVVPRPKDGALAIVYCGRVVQPQKRAMDMIPLVQNLLQTKVDFVLHVVGSGDLLPLLQQDLNAIAGDRIVFHGVVPSTQIPALMAQMHLLISLSDYEGTSISMLEAMGQGVVPVVTDIASGVRDVIQPNKNGWVVPVGDVPKMAEVIADLAKNRAALSAAAVASWESIRDGYSLESNIRAMAGLLKTIARQPRAEYRMNRNHPVWRNGRLELPWMPNTIIRAIRRLKTILPKS
jgi:glycosyltransferase involved in cell wall biosynthesis